jgi:hypothetical protein
MNANLDPTLANRYLANQLSEQERHDYEELIVSSADAIAELEATARLKVGLEKLRDTGELYSLLQQRTRSLPMFLMPIAAVLAAVAIGATLGWSWTPLHTGTASLLFASRSSLVDTVGHSLPIGVTAALYGKRGGISVGLIEKPVSPAAVVLRALPTPLNKSHSYRLSLSRLRDSAFEVVAEIDNLTPTDDGFIECYADAARLAPGRYEVVVTDRTTRPGTAAGLFVFDLAAAQNH